MSEINERARRIRLERRIENLEEQLERVQRERDELSAAFDSLSELVYQNQPHLLRAAKAEEAK